MTPIEKRIIEEDSEEQLVQYRFGLNSGRARMSSVHTKKSNADLEERFKVERYDFYGNPQVVRKSNSIGTVTLYGYDHRLPIARIDVMDCSECVLKGVPVDAFEDPYRAVEWALDQVGVSVSSLQNLSNDVLRSTLINALQQNNRFIAMSTIYTHNLDNGIESITDARGYTTHYQYDQKRRLKNAADEDLRLIAEYKYNNKISD